jgi:uncharacterized membrane protein YeaQ/YmgE (transglycosylase-associated protein family)
MRVTDVLSAVIVGIVIGIAGRLVLPGRQRIGAVVTVLIGVGAAFLGAYVADLLNLTGRYGGRYVNIDWDWLVLAFQIGFAVVGTAIAASIAHTRVAAAETPVKRKRKSRG